MVAVYTMELTCTRRFEFETLSLYLLLRAVVHICDQHLSSAGSPCCCIALSSTPGELRVGQGIACREVARTGTGPFP